MSVPSLCCTLGLGTNDSVEHEFNTSASLRGGCRLTAFRVLVHAKGQEREIASLRLTCPASRYFWLAASLPMQWRMMPNVAVSSSALGMQSAHTLFHAAPCSHAALYPLLGLYDVVRLYGTPRFCFSPSALLLLNHCVITRT